MTIPLATYWLYRSTPHPATVFARNRQNALIWARGVLVAVGVSCIYAAFRFISLSDGMALFHTRPFVVGVICWIWLGERFTGVQMAASGEMARGFRCCPLSLGLDVIGARVRGSHG